MNKLCILCREEVQKYSSFLCDECLKDFLEYAKKHPLKSWNISPFGCKLQVEASKRFDKFCKDYKEKVKFT